MSMQGGYKAKYKGKIPDRDIDVLEVIYQLQAVLTRDLIKAYYTSEQTGKRRLSALHHRGYIEKTRTVNEKGRANGSVCSITDQGIDELVRVGKVIQERRARDLKLPTLEMLLRIEISRVALALNKAGWTIINGREGKTQLSLQSTSPMQFVFTSPEKKVYRVYVLNKNSHDPTLIKIITEIKDSKQGIIVLYKTDHPLDKTPAYWDFVKIITEQSLGDEELCLIPLATLETEAGERDIATECLVYGGDKQAEEYLRKRYSRLKYGDNQYGFGEMVVVQDGAEYLVCNYLRRDQKALRMLARHYNHEEYRKTGREAIVLTWNGFAGEVRQLIDSYQKRDFIKVEGITVRDILDSRIESAAD